MRRTDLHQLLEAALAARQFDYVCLVARPYLADWPGDLTAQYALARAFAGAGEAGSARSTLEALLAADPENFAAHRLLGDQLAAAGQASASIAYANAHIGDGRGGPNLPAWAAPARTAYLADRTGDLATTLRASASLLEVAQPSPLPALLHLFALWHAHQLDLALPLAEGLHARWPQLIAVKLCLAECRLAAGNQSRAIELLHTAAAQDLSAVVAGRHLGQAHPYQALWPANTDLPFNLPAPLPAALVAHLGLNRLTGHVEAAKNHPPQPAAAGQSPAAQPQPPEHLADIQAQLNTLSARLVAKRKGTEQYLSYNGYYLLLTSRTHLTQIFGQTGFVAVDTALKALALSVSVQVRMSTHVLYVDDPEALTPFGLTPVDPANAWEIKLLLGKLSQHLQTRDSHIGAVFIIGGPAIIPFHHLPNPTDDADPDIPSDNPYATADENYFIPEWPLGRLPTGADTDPALLLRALQIAANGHLKKEKSSPAHWLRRMWTAIRRLFQPAAAAAPGNFGYSANVWREASTAVYTTIGDPAGLLTCPPLNADALPAERLAPAQFSYFNLHGVEDGGEWYGQRGPTDPPNLPEYPIALRPADIHLNGNGQRHAPLMVYSEACYGANILNKKSEEALCLRFLNSGARVMVGSTKIAYGSVASPLIGADLLGRYFWQNLNAGMPAGEALRHAKLQMAQEMHTRQGFLDGEDQKTLIAFVLYGDPLATGPTAFAPHSFSRAGAAPPPSTVNDKVDGPVNLSPETVANIKALVAQYLPGMSDASWRAAQARAGCAIGAKHIAPAQKVTHTVVTLSKTIRTNTRAHPHYARVTLNEHGAIIKLAVSR